MPLNAGQSKLAADHFGLAVAVARRAARGFGVQAIWDADGPAAEAVCEAAVQWTGAGTFGAFLTCVVRRKVIDWARQQNYLPRSGRPNSRRVVFEPLSPAGQVTYADDRLTRAQSRDAVELAVADLPEPQRHVLTRVYRDGWTMTEAAEERGRVRSWGAYRHAEGIAALRAEAG